MSVIKTQQFLWMHQLFFKKKQKYKDIEKYDMKEKYREHLNQGNETSLLVFNQMHQMLVSSYFCENIYDNFYQNLRSKNM